MVPPAGRKPAPAMDAKGMSVRLTAFRASGSVLLTFSSSVRMEM